MKHTIQGDKFSYVPQLYLTTLTQGKGLNSDKWSRLLIGGKQKHYYNPGVLCLCEKDIN